MKISEVIKFLESACIKHGDIQVGVMDIEIGDSYVAELEIVSAHKNFDSDALGDVFVRVRM